MLNEIINIDLHIHSSDSFYKDGEIVRKSNIDNLDTLIGKLNEHNISLCSITDHNRFNFKLYNALKAKLKDNATGSLKHNLPGIEFDVKLEKDKPKCHIVAIFDDSDFEKVKIIENKMFAVKKISASDDYYTLDEFEKVLRSIGINVILIVHQRQGLDNNLGKTDSLSSATNDPYKFIKVGYIDCLEYNYPRVEGIVKSSLRNVDLDIPIITGSDCHEREYYPYHDGKTTKVPRDFTKFKCLPSFKGLLMSITSFDTRKNRKANTNKHYIKNILINGKNYPLSNGINVIIGDNGSGKSLLADVLGSNLENYYKYLIDKNNISVEYSDDSFQIESINYIKQGKIMEQVKNGNLFDNNQYFEDIKTKDIFSKQIKNYFDSLCKYVDKNIHKNELLLELKNTNLNITPIDKNFYHPVIKNNREYDDTNFDKQRLDELESIINNLKSEIENNEEYYSTKKIIELLKNALKNLEKSHKNIFDAYDRKILSNKVKKIISDNMSNMDKRLKTKRTTEEGERNEIIKTYNNFKKIIIDYIKSDISINEFPVFPEKLDGFSIKEYKGYNFYRTAKYHEQYLKDEFYNHCFNKNFATEEKIKKIKTRDDFSNALHKYTYKELEDFKAKKVCSFIDEYSKETTTISEITSGSKIGNTPGEISLVYYKFTIEESDDKFNVLIIDQPEDDINPKKIKSHLNKYLDSIRDEKQIIIVTHNPLLVVNLDVDNVIHLEKNYDCIEVKSGALEFENNDYSILNLVKENLDGGYEAIERRLRAYGKDNN